jgi:hypothetical protein
MSADVVIVPAVAAAANKPVPNVWSWNSLEKSGRKVYDLPAKATGTDGAGQAVKDGIAAGRLFYFQN